MNNVSVLVVEDDEAIRDGLCEILEMEGFTVQKATHGKHALEKIDEQKSLPNVILLDLNMPVMSGVEFQKNLKSKGSRYADVPILVMSAVPNATIAGVAGYLRKPVDIDLLLKKVQMILLGTVNA